MMQNFYMQTKKYYAAWLDIPVERFENKGISLIETPKRKICPKGYPKNLEMYCVAFNDSIFISYSPELSKNIEFNDIFNGAVDVSTSIIKMEKIFTDKLRHRRAHYFTKLPKNIDTSKVVLLKNDNYNDYLQFFISQNPNASPDGWLYDYFVCLVKNNRCFGVYDNNILVCAIGAPDIPFMDDLITEPGIDTLIDYRRRGYAKAACAKYLEFALKQNKVPIWTCGHNNTASYKLAESLGYKWFCDLYTIEGNISYK